VILSGLGHNAHVEAPEALWPLLERLAAARADETPPSRPSTISFAR
jgi:hypothetical protein